jgi:hypothetical protein
LQYEKGPTPIPNIPFTMRGAKTIGTNGSGQNIYKFSQSLTSGASGSFSTSTLEWDTYTITIDPNTTGYDISESCLPLPLSLLPGASTVLNIFLSPHTANSLLVSETDDTSGAQLSGVTVRLQRSGVDITQTTDSCGQTFFPSLSSGSGATGYSLTLSKPGYVSETVSSLTISGATNYVGNLSPL